ncbi:hypothetical protein NFI96_006271 [Prochilodus magdalenae]|nr:hypothetical protein NFI96_006271 [Prochilodus magdalenae]
MVELCPNFFGIRFVDRSTRSSPPAPWLSDVLHSNRRELRRAERKWRRSQLDSDLHTYQGMTFIPSTTGPHRDLAISFGNSLITPTEDARSLGVILGGQLSFSAHITNLTQSCRFLLYNIRRIRPFLSQEATQLLVQSLVISRLDHCNSLLAGLPLGAIRPLQLVQNAAARLIFSLPKFTHITPLLRSLHWLPVVARIRFKTLMLAYKAKMGPAPPYLMAIVKSRAVPRALRASSTARLDAPSLRTHGRQASRLFSVLAPRWWNELPLGVRTVESLAVFKHRLKTHLFVMHFSE